MGIGFGHVLVPVQSQYGMELLQLVKVCGFEMSSDSCCCFLTILHVVTFGTAYADSN